MCGISAIIDSSSNPVQIDMLRRMNNFIKHRGPDGEGLFLEGPVGLGHRMLKITDLGCVNVQPMRFKDYVISYNGEIYNFRELRRELEKLGYQFHTATDTEVLLAAYDAWKEECVHHFNGMWAFVLFDQQRKLIFASRDRFGIKPLCYTQLKKQFLIGSEIKQFLAFHDFTCKLNQPVAFDFLFNARLNTSEESMFEDVWFLPPGSNLIYDLNTHRHTIHKWYDLNKNYKKISIDFNEAIIEFRKRFTESMLDHLYSPVPLGSCLSGGIDSTSIMGIAAEAGIRPNTYSTCFLTKDYNEIKYIDSAVDHYKVPNFKIYPDIRELITKGELDKLVYLQDQPIFSGSFYSEYKIYGLAASHQTRVILGGGGADECIAGYGEFYHVFLRSLMRNKKLLRYTSEYVQLPQLKIRLKQLLRQYARISGSNAGVFNNILKDSFQQNWFTENFVQTEAAEERKDVDDLIIFAMMNYSLPHQLHSEDRNSMHFSLESRLPYLDHRIVEFCLSLPDNFKLRNGTTKYILRESMKPLLPDLVYNRKHKLGLPGPEEPLFQSQLPSIRECFKELIRHYPDIFSDRLLTMLQHYDDGKIAYHNFFFRVLSFAAWAKRFNVMPATSTKTKRINFEKTSEAISSEFTSY